MDALTLALAKAFTESKIQQLLDSMDQPSTDYWDRHGVRRERLPLSISLKREGEAWHPVDLKPVDTSGPVVVTLPVARIPTRRTIDEFIAIGVDAHGYVVGRNVSGTLYRRTNDGGRTFETISPNKGMQHLWVDSQGNKYAGSGANIYRAEAGENNWEFEDAFAFREGFANQWAFAEDGNGYVWFIPYSSAAGERSYDLWTSDDWGKTFTVQTIDYGQRHLHKIHCHKPTGNLYIAVGEGGTWKGIIKSTDKGATWTQIPAMENVIQPTMSLTIGKYILWGRDTAGMFLVHDTETDEIKELRVDSTHNETAGNFMGFVFGMGSSDGVIYAPAQRAITEGEYPYPFNAIVGNLDPVSLWTPTTSSYNLGRWIVGPDASGALYMWEQGNNYSVVLESGGYRYRKAFYTHKASVLSVQEYPENVEPSTSYYGYPVVKTIGTQWPTEYFAVTPGQQFNIVALFKRRPEGDEDIRFEIRWYDETSHRSTVYSQLYPNSTRLPDSDQFFKIIVGPFTPPEGTTRARVGISKHGAGGADNYHLFVNRLMVVQATTNDVTFAPSEFTDTLRASVAVSDGFMFRDRIYQMGYLERLAEGVDAPLLNVNHVEIGVRRGPSLHEHYVYVKEGEAETSVRAAQFMGSPNRERPTLHLSTSVLGLRRALYMPPPIIVGITTDSVMIYSPETGEITTVPLSTPIEGRLEFEMTGTAYHIPDVFKRVDSDDLEELLTDL